MSVDTGTPVTPQDDLRERAVQQLKKRRDFGAHLLSYVMVNGFLIGIWAVTSSGFFWPIFPMAGWGIGIVMHAWDVFHGYDFREDEIQREMTRLAGRR